MKTFYSLVFFAKGNWYPDISTSGINIFAKLTSSGHLCSCLSWLQFSSYLRFKYIFFCRSYQFSRIYLFARVILIFFRFFEFFSFEYYSGQARGGQNAFSYLISLFAHKPALWQTYQWSVNLGLSGKVNGVELSQAQH